MRFMLELAWRDLRATGRSLWVFCACLTLGVTLVAASSGLYRMIQDGLLTDTRELLGGDVRVDSKSPIDQEALEWMAQHGKVSLVTELFTMLATQTDDLVRVELQVVDQQYPLYGQLQLEPDISLATAIAKKDGVWGIAVDPALADQHDVKVGDLVYIGALEMQIRALIRQQPDRNLTANWRGPPILLTHEAIEAAELIQPGSRLDYDYRVATEIPVDRWKARFYQRFPDRGWQVRTFEDRSQRISERLGQIASGLIIIGFSTLFIGGLGVFSSIRSYLQTKLKTIATLRSLGLRNSRVAAVYLIQIALLGGGSSLLGILLGAGLAVIGSTLVASEVPIGTSLSTLPLPLLGAFVLGIATAFCFALPAIGSALAVLPARLFRGSVVSASSVPRIWILATFAVAAGVITLVLISTPSFVVAAAFVLVVALLMLLLEVILRIVRKLALGIDGTQHPRWGLPMTLALANLHRPQTPLRSTLISLGSALTLLVICTLVVVSLLRTIHQTIPQEAPALVLYDISNHQVEPIQTALEGVSDSVRYELTPLVTSRILNVNGAPVASLLEQSTPERLDALNGDHKLSYRGGNIDSVELVEGHWWPENVTGHLLSLEDREARRIGIGVGERITYSFEGIEREFEIAAIHRQKGMQTRFWFEAIVSDRSLDEGINRSVGAVWMANDRVPEAQKRVAAVAPNVITVRTEKILSTASDLLYQATSGLAVIAMISFIASMLVLFSVIAASRARQIYEACILNTLGVRHSQIRQSLYLEFLLIGIVTVVFAVMLGTLIAMPVLELRMKIPASDLMWVGMLAAVVVSFTTLSIGAAYLLQRLKIQPARVLRTQN